MLIPPSTNDAYRGARVSAWFLTLLACLTIAPGLIHSFLPDGGAGVIAGLDLSRDGRTIITLFAWAGATQIVWGALLFAISLRFRSLVPFALALLLIERALHAVNMWVRFASEEAVRPPEAWLTLISLPILAAFLALSLRARRAALGVTATTPAPT